MTKCDTFQYIGKPKYIRSEQVSGGQIIIFHCEGIKFKMGDFAGCIEEYDIHYYTAKDVSLTSLREATCITLEGIISDKKKSANREFVALTLKEEK